MKLAKIINKLKFNTVLDFDNFFLRKLIVTKLSGVIFDFLKCLSWNIIFNELPLQHYCRDKNVLQFHFQRVLQKSLDTKENFLYVDEIQFPNYS